MMVLHQKWSNSWKTKTTSLSVENMNPVFAMSDLVMIGGSNKVFRLWFWNPWDFGHWIFQKEAKTIGELLSLVVGKPSVTYKITRDDKIVKSRKAASHWWRHGMVEPKDIGGSCR